MNDQLSVKLATLVFLVMGLAGCSKGGQAPLVSKTDVGESEVFYTSGDLSVDRSSVCGQIERQLGDETSEAKTYIVHYQRGRVLLLPQTQKMEQNFAAIEIGEEDSSKQACAYGYLKEGSQQDSALQVEEFVIMENE